MSDDPSSVFASSGASGMCGRSACRVGNCRRMLIVLSLTHSGCCEAIDEYDHPQRPLTSPRCIASRNGRSILIARDRLHFRAQQRVERRRHNLRAGADADDQFLFPRFLQRRDLGGVPGNAGMNLTVEAADPPQRGRVEIRPRQSKQRRGDHGGHHGRERQAVARRDLGDVARRPQAAGARHMLDGEGRVAGDEPPE